MEKAVLDVVNDQDHSWVREFQSGLESGFNQLVNKHRDKAFNLCYRLLGDYEEANDCAQETFVRVYKALGRFKMESAFSTWLYRIVVNVCKTRLTSADFRRKKQSVTYDDVRENSVTSRLGRPEEDLQQKWEREKIQECINALAGDHKAIVVLRDIDGLAYEEIAGIIKQGLGTVKSRLARARDQLKKCLKGLF
jgi:RNA polymerase sigma-70 factor (ECF subfamily)